MVEVENGSDCLATVVSTGAETQRGKLLKTVLFGLGFRYPQNLGIVCFLSWLVGFVFNFITEKNDNAWYYWYQLLTGIFTLHIPATLYSAISGVPAFSSLRQTEKGIMVRHINRLLVSGNTDFVCLDKTGTITVANLDFKEARAFSYTAAISRSKNHKVLHKILVRPLQQQSYDDAIETSPSTECFEAQKKILRLRIKF